MKKSRKIIMLTFTLIILAAGVTIAQSTIADSQKQNPIQGKNFIDKNNDGICDNYVNRPSGKGRNYIDKDNDGICDNRSGSLAKPVSRGPRFANSNKGGICENHPQNNCCQGKGKRQGCGRYGYRGGR